MAGSRPQNAAKSASTPKPKQKQSASALKPTTILLIRHAETPTTGKVLPGRAAGLGLSEKGVTQAEARAAEIADKHHIAAVYSSPMERAQQTAAPIGTATRRKVRIHEGLNECDFGLWTGRRLKALYKLPAWRTVQRTPSNFRFPEGESFLEMQSRIAAALNELARAHRGKTVVAVSHADTIKAAVAHALGMHLDMFQRLAVSPASQTVIQLGAGAPIVVSVNG